MRCIGLVFRNRCNECSSFFVEEPDNRDLSASYLEFSRIHCNDTNLYHGKSTSISPELQHSSSRVVGVHNDDVP